MRILVKPVEILIVENNAGDIGLIEEVFEEAKIKNKLLVAEDGEEAILFHNENPLIPIIILSGSNDEEIGTYAVEKGAHEFFVKGQTDGKLLECIIQCSI
jgi:CheY-like chemotaxis protein